MNSQVKSNTVMENFLAHCQSFELTSLAQLLVDKEVKPTAEGDRDYETVPHPFNFITGGGMFF